MKQITVVVKEPGKEAEVRSIEAKLEVFQGLVGGLIEGACVDEYMREHDIITYINDEGKLIGLAPNILAFDCQDVIVGTCVFVKGDENGDDVSLEQDEIEHVLEYCKRNGVGQGITIIDLLKLFG